MLRTEWPKSIRIGRSIKYFWLFVSVVKSETVGVPIRTTKGDSSPQKTSRKHQNTGPPSTTLSEESIDGLTHQKTQSRLSPPKCSREEPKARTNVEPEERSRHGREGGMKGESGQLYIWEEPNRAGNGYYVITRDKAKEKKTRRGDKKTEDTVKRYEEELEGSSSQGPPRSRHISTGCCPRGSPGVRDWNGRATNC